MRCKDVSLELSAYLNKELTKEKHQAIEDHILNCSLCAKELIRVRKLEEELKIEALASKDSLGNYDVKTGNSQLGDWLITQSKKLSHGEIGEKQQWVKGITGEEIMEKEETTVAYSEENKTNKKRSPKAKLQLIAAGLVAILMLFTFWPQAVRASVNLPIVGQWIEQLMLRDAGLNWAYENGYMDGQKISTEKDGVKLTILGVVADPVQTAIIYLVEGLKSNDPKAFISKIDGEGASSWASPAESSPLGMIGIAQTKALPGGDHELTIVLKEDGNLTSDLELKVIVSPDEISRVSKHYDLDYEATVEEVTVKAREVVYTPTQIMVSYSVEGGSNLQGTIDEKYVMYLETATGEKLDIVSGYGTLNEEGVWELQAIFNRPKDISNLAMVIPALGKYEDVAIDFGPEDLNIVKNIEGTEIELTQWEHSSEELKIHVAYTKEGKLDMLTNWVVTDENGKTYETEYTQYRLYGSSSTITIGDKLPLESGVVPVKVTAKEARIIIEGNWKVKLPQVK